MNIWKTAQWRLVIDVMSLLYCQRSLSLTNTPKKFHSLLMKSLWCKLAYQPFLTQVQKFSNKVSNYVMLLLMLILILKLVDQIRHHNCSSLWYDGLWLLKQGTRELKLLNNYWLIKIDERWKKLIALSPWSTKNLQYEKGEMHCNLNHA